MYFFFFSSRRRHTRYWRDWSSDVCSSDLLAVAACPRREALRPEVERLEQVGLAGAVRAHREHDAGLELQVERGVRADVPKRDLRDDQPARSAPSAGEPDRHDQVREVFTLALDQSRAER